MEITESDIRRVALGLSVADEDEMVDTLKKDGFDEGEIRLLIVAGKTLNKDRES